MRARVLLVLLGISCMLLVGRAAVEPLPISSDRIWFSPAPGALDYLRLFDHPAEWERARRLVTVFKFYQQHTHAEPPSIVGPNSYDALVRNDVFRKLTSWKIKTALEVGAVKDYWCTADGSGMQAAVAGTVDAAKRVQQAGGDLKYLAMDEPWVSGRLRVCGGPALEPTADRLKIYMTGVRAALPGVRLGLIEAYPFSSADAIERMLALLKDRGVMPDFLHMDVDWHALKSGEFVRDLPRLQRAAQAERIPFGIIIVGYNGDADPLYAEDAAGIANLSAEAFQTWDRMPEQFIFQSWVVSRTGLLITPTNLPEDRRFTHTNLILDLSRRLYGAQGGATGSAVPRGGG